MSEEANLLRSMAYADKEAKITAVTVTDVPSLFTSALTSGYQRKGLFAYNNSNDTSGEVYYGYGAVMSSQISSRPIPKGSVIEIPIQGLDVYFCSASGEYGDLRVEELA